MALELVRSNEQLGEMLSEVSQLKPYLNGEGQRLHLNFYERLEQRYPTLTVNERQLCALLRMGLSNPEITAITQRTLNSVHAAKSRLRKKLGVELDEELQGVLNAL